MNIDQVEAFLAIVEFGSITEASNFLFTSQSTISTRIKSLEEYLGIKLFIRKQGQKSVVLTPKGEKFLELAKNMRALYMDAKNIKDLKPKTILNIAGVDAINNYTFVPLYTKFINNKSNIKLKISTHHSEEIHGLVESRKVDIGFVYSEIKYHDVLSKPIIKENNYLITHKDSKYKDGISPKDLDPSKEIFLDWSPDYFQWHYHFFGNNDKNLVTVNTGNLIQYYLNEPGNWAIAPMSAIKPFISSTNIKIIELDSPPPPRVSYMLTHKDIKVEKLEAINIFKEEMERYIKSNNDVFKSHTWNH